MEVEEEGGDDLFGFGFECVRDEGLGEGEGEGRDRVMHRGCIKGEMEIPVRRRIKAVSWVHIVDGPSGGRVDVRYRFCGRAGEVVESLVL